MNGWSCASGLRRGNQEVVGGGRPPARAAVATLLVAGAQVVRRLVGGRRRMASVPCVDSPSCRCRAQAARCRRHAGRQARDRALWYPDPPARQTLKVAPERRSVLLVPRPGHIPGTLPVRSAKSRASSRSCRRRSLSSPWRSIIGSPFRPLRRDRGQTDGAGRMTVISGSSISLGRPRPRGRQGPASPPDTRERSSCLRFSSAWCRTLSGTASIHRHTWLRRHPVENADTWSLSPPCWRHPVR